MRSHFQRVARGCGVFLLGLASTCLLRAADPPPRLEALQAALESVGPEVVNQVILARAELAKARAEDGWTPEIRAQAQQWLDSLLPSEVVANPGAASPHLHLRRQSRVLANARKSRQLAGPAGAFADLVTDRLEYVITLQSRWWSDYCGLVTKVAEEAWLAADEPSDLLPALRILERFKALAIDPAPANDPARVPRPFPLIGLKVNGVAARLADDEPLSAVLIFSGPEPLLLPDPRKDPENYKRMRLLWHNLAGWQLRFCERYMVGERVSENDRYFQRSAMAAQREFEGFIIEGASAEKIAAAWQQVELFHVATESFPPYRAPNEPPTPFPVPRPGTSKVKGAQRPDFTNTFPADYRELLALPTGKRPGDPTAGSYFRPVLYPEPYESDRLLIALLAAEPGSAAVEECRRRILSHWPRYSAEMKSWLQKKLGVDSLARTIEKESSRAESAALLAIPAGVSDFQAVEKVLEDAASSIRKGGAIPQAVDLLAQWRMVSPALKSSTQEGPYRQSADWSQLSTHPGGVALMAARDRALREVICQIGKMAPNHEPLPALLRGGLEAMMVAGDWPRYDQLLNIAQVGGLLELEESNEWRTAGAILSSKAADSADPRRDCLSLLRRSISPAVAKVAAQRLKALTDSR